MWLVALVFSCAALTALLARALYRFIERLRQRIEQLKSELAAEQARQKDDATPTKKARGRRDAFNEILLGLEEQAKQVQQDRDNLEQLVRERTLALQRRNEAMRLVLDNVDQGLATIQLDGKFSPERSRAFDEWFGGATDAEGGFEQRLARHDGAAQGMLLLGWEQLLEGILPLDVLIDQMPKKLAVRERHYALEYKPILEKGALQGILLVATDLTDHLERLRRDAEQREIIGIFERLMRDRSGFVEFFQECDSLVRSVLSAQGQSSTAVLRALHTLKGNCALFGVTSVAEIAHELESEMLEEGAPPQALLAELSASWQQVSARVSSQLGSSAEPAVELLHAEFQHLADAVAAHLPHAEIAARLEQLKQERVVLRLRRAAEQARALAPRLGKAELEVEVSASDELRFPAAAWAPFWAAFVHVVRNAVDHGIEAVPDRRSAGKPDSGTLRLSAQIEADHFTLEVADDGRGIDWERVRLQARERHLPHARESDLIDALFADGLSAARTVSEISGRGMGMGAVRAATQALGGEVQIRSVTGRGTTMRFVFPSRPSSSSILAAAQ